MGKKKITARERQRREEAALKANAFTTLVGKKKLLPAEKKGLMREGLERVTRRPAWTPPATRFVPGTTTSQLQRRPVGDQTDGWRNVGEPVQGTTVTVTASGNDEYRIQRTDRPGRMVFDVDSHDYRFNMPVPIEDDETLALKQLGYLERDNLAHLKRVLKG